MTECPTDRETERKRDINEGNMSPLSTARLSFRRHHSNCHLHFHNDNQSSKVLNEPNDIPCWLCGVFNVDPVLIWTMKAHSVTGNGAFRFPKKDIITTHSL